MFPVHWLLVVGHGNKGKGMVGDKEHYDCNVRTQCKVDLHILIENVFT